MEPKKYVRIGDDAPRLWQGRTVGVYLHCSDEQSDEHRIKIDGHVFYFYSQEFEFISEDEYEAGMVISI